MTDYDNWKLASPYESESDELVCELCGELCEDLEREEAICDACQSERTREDLARYAAALAQIADLPVDTNESPQRIARRALRIY